MSPPSPSTNPWNRPCTSCKGEPYLSNILQKFALCELLWILIVSYLSFWLSVMTRKPLERPRISAGPSKITSLFLEHLCVQHSSLFIVHCTIISLMMHSSMTQVRLKFTCRRSPANPWNRDWRWRPCWRWAQWQTTCSNKEWCHREHQWQCSRKL